MSVYYINPTVDVNDLNFKEIMDTMTNDISNLFTYNRNLIEQNNYIFAVNNIIIIVSNYLKIYNFYDNDKKNINIQIYNLNIEVIINIEFKIFKTFYTYQKSNWERFYNGNIKDNPIVYYGLDLSKRQELRISLINGNFYMYDDVKLLFPLDEGIILKKKLCTCENINNSNIYYSYIVTVYW